MNGTVVPPGIRFYPTEEELLLFYLPNKLSNSRQEIERVIPVVDVYAFDPSHLPPMSGEANTADPEQWFFFCPQQEREAQGGRPARTTPSGYWKTTGSTSLVYSRSDHSVIGLKKTMVFYTGRAPTGSKTIWKMNEYKVIQQVPSASPPSARRKKVRNEFSLCRVYVKSGTVRSFDRRPLDLGLLPAVGGDARRTTTDEAAASRCLGGSSSGEDGSLSVDADAQLLEGDWEFGWHDD